MARTGRPLAADGLIVPTALALRDERAMVAAMELDREKIGPALGKLPSGVYVATSMLDGEEIGMLASFVEQAGFEPPMITAAVSKGRRLEAAIEQSGKFGINILGEEDARLMKPFSLSDNDSPFADVDLDANEHGLPQLADALGFLACKVVGKIEGGDHTIYAGEVFDGILNDPACQPMVRIRKNGFQY